MKSLKIVIFGSIDIASSFLKVLSSFVCLWCRPGEHRADALSVEPGRRQSADRRSAYTGSRTMSCATATDRCSRVGRRQTHRTRPRLGRRPTTYAQTSIALCANSVTLLCAVT